MGLRDALRRLRREARDELVEIPQQDGTVARFAPEDLFPGAFLHETERWRAFHNGDPVPPAHPVTEALRRARDLDALQAQHGQLVGMLVGEDRIIRGEKKRTGPPAEWSEDGTVCY